MYYLNAGNTLEVWVVVKLGTVLGGTCNKEPGLRGEISSIH